MIPIQNLTYSPIIEDDAVKNHVTLPLVNYYATLTQLIQITSGNLLLLSWTGGQDVAFMEEKMLTPHVQPNLSNDTRQLAKEITLLKSEMIDNFKKVGELIQQMRSHKTDEEEDESSELFPTLYGNDSDIELVTTLSNTNTSDQARWVFFLRGKVQY